MFRTSRFLFLPALRVLAFFLVSFISVAVLAQDLQIHQINVGWGNCTYVKAPNGKTVLMDAGDTGFGTGQVKPYLVSISAPTLIDVVIASHMHCDHLGGLDELIGAGYTAGVQYSNGSSYTNSCVTGWQATSPTPVRMPVNTVIDLGSGCSLICVGNWDEAAGNYEVCDGTRVTGVSNENDKSIAILVSCGGWQYLWTGDLGGGNTDSTCTGRSTTQTDVETALIAGIINMGYIPAGGIDILSVGHHGSESSTNANMKNSAMPEYAICATGRGQTSGWALPRKIVIDDVVLGGASCITPPGAIKVFQTEEGDAADANGDRSYSGFCVGDIVMTYHTATGQYCIDADGAVDYGPNEYASSGLPLCRASDGGTACAAPTAEVIETARADKSGFTWADIAGADYYRVLRGVQADLPGLISSSTDFSCHSYGISSGPTGVSIASDDPSGVAGACYYYLVQGYACADPEANLGPAGSATAGPREIDLAEGCAPPCASVSASIASVSPSATVTLGTQQTFNGSGTGQGTLTYEWDFHYDGTFSQEGVGQSTAYTYPAVGDYTAALRVTDSCGTPQSATATIAVSVTGQPTCSPAVVISRVYGGGGNSGAYWRSDFIELHNRSSVQVASLAGWSVQYASASGTTWQVTALSGSIPAGGYFLVQEATGSGGTASLPTPDVTGSINMSATAGKVALVASTTALSGSCPTGGYMVDLVGFGTANCFEGSGAAGALTNTTSASRSGSGCNDTNNNSADFSVGVCDASTPPRNGASAPVGCGCT